MDEIIKDTRFSHIVKDPRFKRIPKREKKVRIDKRFQSMFNDKRFKVKYTVDKRGRPVDHTSSEDLKRYYAVSSGESDESQSDSDRDLEDVGKQTKTQISSLKLNDKTKLRKTKHVSNIDNGSAKNKLNLMLSQKEREEEEDDDDDDEEEEEEREKKKSLDDYEDEHSDEAQNDVLTDIVKEKLRDMKVDYARGEGVLLSESSSDEESTESDSEEELEHGWGELDHDAEHTDKATNRLAVCHMDWDKIRAADLMVLFNSFLPTGGVIHSVTIYPSEFGLQRMKEEEIKGPIELTENSLNPESGEGQENEEENEEGSKFHMEKLRQYQLNRLKYFYAIVECDSVATAEKIYNECDGLEYESSATKLDLRFVPDDTVFDQEPRETCDSLPDLAKYCPRYFTTTALQQAKVELTWDETNPERQELTKKLMSGQVDGVSEADLQAYLASSSSEESDNEGENEVSSEKDGTSQGKEDALSKYRALLEEIKTKEEKKNSHNLEMEVTWGLDLKDKTEKLVKKKLQNSKNLTPFQQFLEKRKEKRKQKREDRKKQSAQQGSDASDNDFSDDDIPSDVDMNDPYFKEELEKMTKTKKVTKREKKESEEVNEDGQNKAELELLLMEESDTKHFSLKSIQEKESEKKKKKKKKKNITKDEASTEKDDFQVNVNDERFSALFSSHHFNIDPTDPHYRKTKGMETLRSEKLKRRNTNKNEDGDNGVPSKLLKKNLDAELSVLVKSVKRKANTLKKGTVR